MRIIRTCCHRANSIRLLSKKFKKKNTNIWRLIFFSIIILKLPRRCYWTYYWTIFNFFINILLYLLFLLNYFLFFYILYYFFRLFLGNIILLSFFSYFKIALFFRIWLKSANLCFFLLN